MENNIKVGDTVRLYWDRLSHTMFSDLENPGYLVSCGDYYRTHGYKIGIVIKQRTYKSGQRSYVVWCGDSDNKVHSIPTYALIEATEEKMQEHMDTMAYWNSLAYKMDNYVEVKSV